jgi:hypothetical protein
VGGPNVVPPVAIEEKMSGVKFPELVFHVNDPSYAMQNIHWQILVESFDRFATKLGRHDSAKMAPVKKW